MSIVAMWGAGSLLGGFVRGGGCAPCVFTALSSAVSRAPFAPCLHHPCVVAVQMCCLWGLWTTYTSCEVQLASTWGIRGVLAQLASNWALKSLFWEGGSSHDKLPELAHQKALESLLDQ